METVKSVGNFRFGIGLYCTDLVTYSHEKQVILNRIDSEDDLSLIIGWDNIYNIKFSWVFAQHKSALYAKSEKAKILFWISVSYE